MLNHKLKTVSHSRIDLTYNLTNTDCSTYNLTNQYSTYLCFTVKHRTNKLVHYKTDNYSKQQQETHDYIKSLHDSGLGYRKIAKQLNEEGIKTIRGNTWGSNNVHSVLKRNKQKLQREEIGKQDSEIEYGKMELVWLREGELYRNPRKELTSLPNKSN